MDEIFGNKMKKSVIKKGNKAKNKFIKKFGDDREKVYHLTSEAIPVLEDLGVQNLLLSEKGTPFDFEKKSQSEKPLIIGNIRMGFGHYRISIALASCAKAMGYTPYWFDLHSFQNATAGKIIKSQNELYSLGSRLSQKSTLFNKFVWEPINSEGFRQLSYNSSDQKVAQLFAPVYKDLPKDIPFVGAHVYPVQGAVHAGLTNVINAIPDNWPMALHLSEGALHTVQTKSSYLGYLALRGMDKDNILKPMDKEAIKYTGHYVDHELVEKIEEDCEMRIQRKKEGKAVRYLLTIGGAGAQKEIYSDIIKYLAPQIKANKAVLFLNVGDHKNVWEEMLKENPELKNAQTHFDNFEEAKEFAAFLTEKNSEISGIHVFYDKDIFAAVYTTNLLMHGCDVLVTKPSELAFYPIPKLFIRRVGGHEAWGAIHSSEIGDGTYECETKNSVREMLDLFQGESGVLEEMCRAIMKNKKEGIYNGGYEVIKLVENK
ncbi:MAG: hypothetical protein HUK25_08820 [Treponema sp.]|nr:hypothetical protein [Treponema sp.]